MFKYPTGWASIHIAGISGENYVSYINSSTHNCNKMHGELPLTEPFVVYHYKYTKNDKITLHALVEFLPKQNENLQRPSTALRYCAAATAARTPIISPATNNSKSETRTAVSFLFFQVFFQNGGGAFHFIGTSAVLIISGGARLGYRRLRPRG